MRSQARALTSLMMTWYPLRPFQASHTLAGTGADVTDDVAGDANTEDGSRAGEHDAASNAGTTNNDAPINDDLTINDSATTNTDVTANGYVTIDNNATINNAITINGQAKLEQELAAAQAQVAGLQAEVAHQQALLAAGKATPQAHVLGSAAAGKWRGLVQQLRITPNAAGTGSLLQC